MDVPVLNSILDQLVGFAAAAEEHEVKLALLVIATGAREQFPDARYVSLNDSDQGDWLVVDGVMDAEAEEILDEDPDDDWAMRASNLYDNRTYVYEPYLTEKVGNLKRRRGPYLLDINRVLADADKLMPPPLTAKET
jgi:hypothetical protein